MVDTPYYNLRQEITNHGDSLGTSTSLARAMIESPSADEHVQKWVAGTVYGGGADTLHSAINRFLVAMMLYPEVQKTARAEIDQLTAGSRLPDLNE